MTQAEKELLLKDLCARLPYGVKGKTLGSKTCTLSFIGNDGSITADTYHCWFSSKQFVPYLRPMSSMTEEECIALSKLTPYETDAWKYIKTPVPLYIANIEQFDFFHRHHLDWRGLISKGLAIEVTEENNPYKE